MLSVLTCITVEHDLRLVVVAALICATACGAAFGFNLRSLKTAEVIPGLRILRRKLHQFFDGHFRTRNLA